MNIKSQSIKTTRRDPNRVLFISSKDTHNIKVSHSQSPPSTFKIDGQVHHSSSQNQNPGLKAKAKRPNVVIHATIRSPKSITSTSNKSVKHENNLLSPLRSQDKNYDMKKNSPQQNGLPTRTDDTAGKYEAYNQERASIVNNDSSVKINRTHPYI
ncbi:hypothetical protein I4U23_027389 [Adineta vaga]|nr:hypothetical protein I4U23_027389 [Adineta vaga]